MIKNDDGGVNKLLQLVKNPGASHNENKQERDEEEDPQVVAAVNAVLEAAAAHCKADLFDMQEIISIAADELRVQIREQAEAEDGG